MPTIKTITLYQYDELPTDKAKAKAREWMSNCIGEDFSNDVNWEPVETAAKLLGITFDTRTVKTRNGKTYEENKISWSGFWSQGDGASYDARYAQDADPLVMLVRVMQEFPTNTKLHDIARGLTELQSKYNGQLTGSVMRDSSAHYCHENTMQIGAIHADEDDSRAVADEDEETFLRLMRQFAKWIYAYLEAEYEYQTGDENVIDALQANEYTFTEDGKRED